MFKKFISLLLVFVISTSFGLTAYSGDLIPTQNLIVQQLSHFEEFVILQETDDLVVFRVKDGSLTATLTLNKHSNYITVSSRQLVGTSYIENESTFNLNTDFDTFNEYIEDLSAVVMATGIKMTLGVVPWGKAAGTGLATTVAVNHAVREDTSSWAIATPDVIADLERSRYVHFEAYLNTRTGVVKIGSGISFVEAQNRLKADKDVWSLTEDLAEAVAKFTPNHNVTTPEIHNKRKNPSHIFFDHVHTKNPADEEKRIGGHSFFGNPLRGTYVAN
jgi:hypothetical protein